VLLELARIFHERKPEVGVLMVFFDGEDYGPTGNDMYLGSKHFAADLRDSLSVNGKPVKIEYGILLDMVGDRNLGIYREGHSVDAAPEVVEKVWSAAKELGYQDRFRPQVKYTVDDDHVPLIKAGIKCIDVIDFDYGPWHTLDDTPQKCSAESLKAVGDVIARVVYEEKA
jgi:Zn-dependent M28 family amino/carboxypeptidase